MQEVAAVLLAAMSLINVLPVTEAFTLVYPRLLEERGHDGALVLHVTDELILNLQKSSIAAPLLRVVRYENGKHITSLHKGEEFDGSLYHSKDKFASVHVSRSEDGIEVVNLYLAETKQPTIRLLLTGVETREDEPYLKSKAESISAEETIQELNNYATANKDTHGNPDIVYLLSGRDLYGQRYGRADRGLRGLGYNSGLCAYYHVALGEDKAGTYSGADTAAHEIGHLLGATDDGSPPEPHYPGKPDSRRCSGWYGFIMSYIKTGAASYHYSDCSLQQMRYWVSRVGPSCWRVNAKKIYNVTKKYPGMVMTPEVYCQRLFPNEQNVTADPGEWFKATCMVRCLYNPSGEVIHTGHTKYKDVYALEHTPCGEEKACIQGFCTEKPQKKPPESERGQ
ncbi:A disintegrin and metalloproteinase with thrombospondin motifs like isoform X2 [Dermacentor andersoni]|uniref:A disintegrin and metalloproteinase with thrombospondin motifs like isoform X2 n=1 Tax=Dermacentor andersoni TaxID=34620 RepID=UPI0024169AE5|nr:A disintegrin and metalloproteinase with thrombospondin motifs like isoform X2 [Dermacentor andersoni]